MSGIEYFIIANPLLTYAIIFVGMFFEGEGLIIFASVFAWQGHLNWFFLILTVLSGTVAGDLLWYAGGRFLRDTRLGNWLDRRYEKHTSTLDTNIREHYGRLAILSKFMYFTTHPTIFLVGWNRFPFKKFLWITLYSTTIWALCVLSVGYFFGYAIELIGYKKIVHRIEIFAILLFVAVFVFGHLIKKIIAQQTKQLPTVKKPMDRLVQKTTNLREGADNTETQTQSVRAFYKDSLLMTMLNGQAKRAMPETAIFTDIDNTFYKKGSEKAAQELTDDATQQQIPLIAVTGVSFTDVLKRIERDELPYFAAIGGAVGTELWILYTNKKGGPEYRKDEFFHERINAMGFDRLSLIKKSNSLIRELALEKSPLKFNFQEPEKERTYLTNQNAPHQPFKISFHFFASINECAQLTQQLMGRFAEQQVIVCEEINYNRTLAPTASVRKYCADILPVSKAGVISYLSKLGGIKQGVVAGDSGNDVEMLTESETLKKVLAVLVGGYTEEAGRRIRAIVAGWDHPFDDFWYQVAPQTCQRILYIEPEKNGRQAAESIVRALTFFPLTINWDEKI